MQTVIEPLVRKIDITVPHRAGLDLHLAAKFTQCAREYRSTVQIRKGDVLVDGKNIWDVLILEAEWKSKLEIVVTGDDASEAIEGIQELFLE